MSVGEYEKVIMVSSTNIIKQERAWGVLGCVYDNGVHFLQSPMKVMGNEGRNFLSFHQTEGRYES